MSACYTITHDEAGTITSVKADIVVTDVPVDTSSSTPFSVTQSFSVVYNSSAAISLTAGAGNLTPRLRSGNPGYRTGTPVLAGNSIASTLTAVNASYLGLQVMGISPTGACDDVIGATVAFGTDLQTGCTLSLDRSDLQTMCGGGGVYMSGSSHVPIFFPSPPGYVGVLGNADPLDKTQWMVLDKSLSTATSLWDDASGICYDFFTGLDYKFLTADIGSIENPQRKIVAAQVCVIRQLKHLATSHL